MDINAVSQTVSSAAQRVVSPQDRPPPRRLALGLQEVLPAAPSRGELPGLFVERRVEFVARPAPLPPPRQAAAAATTATTATWVPRRPAPPPPPPPPPPGRAAVPAAAPLHRPPPGAPRAGGWGWLPGAALLALAIGLGVAAVRRGWGVGVALLVGGLACLAAAAHRRGAPPPGGEGAAAQQAQRRRQLAEAYFPLAMEALARSCTHAIRKARARYAKIGRAASAA